MLFSILPKLSLTVIIKTDFSFPKFCEQSWFFSQSKDWWFQIHTGLVWSAPIWTIWKTRFGSFGHLSGDLDHSDDLCLNHWGRSVIGVWYSHPVPCAMYYTMYYVMYHDRALCLPWAMIEQQSSFTMVAFPPTGLTPSMKGTKKRDWAENCVHTHNILIHSVLTP